MSTFSASEPVAAGAVVLVNAGTVVVAAGTVVVAGAAVSSSDEQAAAMTASARPTTMVVDRTRRRGWNRDAGALTPMTLDDRAEAALKRGDGRGAGAPRPSSGRQVEEVRQTVRTSFALAAVAPDL